MGDLWFASLPEVDSCFFQVLPLSSVWMAHYYLVRGLDLPPEVRSTTSCLPRRTEYWNFYIKRGFSKNSFPVVSPINFDHISSWVLNEQAPRHTNSPLPSLIEDLCFELIVATIRIGPPGPEHSYILVTRVHAHFVFVRA